MCLNFVFDKVSFKVYINPIGSVSKAVFQSIRPIIAFSAPKHGVSVSAAVDDDMKRTSYLHFKGLVTLVICGVLLRWTHT